MRSATVPVSQWRSARFTQATAVRTAMTATTTATAYRIAA